MNSGKIIKLIVVTVLTISFFFPRESFAITDPVSYTGNSSAGTIAGGVVSAALG